MSRTGTLPTAVCDLAMRLGVQREDDPPRVSLTQTGHMKRTLESDSWMAFKASQTIATHRRAFDWRAKVGPFGLISGPDTLSVSAGVGAMAAEVILGLDGGGRIATAFAPDRPRSATPPILPTPWHGRYSDYRLVDTIWLPMGAEVAWILGAKDIAYWRCHMESWHADAVDADRKRSKRNRMTGTP